MFGDSHVAQQLEAKANLTQCPPLGVSDKARGSLSKTETPQPRGCQIHDTGRPQSLIIPFLSSILSPLPTQHLQQPDTSHASGFPVSQICTSSNESGPLGFAAADHNMQWDATPPATTDPMQFYPSADELVNSFRLPELPAHQGPGVTDPSMGASDDIFSDMLPTDQPNTYTAPDSDPLVHRKYALDLAHSALGDDPRIGGQLVAKGSAWSNTARHKIFMFHFGPNRAPDTKSPFCAYRGKRADKLPKQWRTLATVDLEEKRSVSATASQWNVLEDQLTNIITRFTESINDQLPVVLAQIYAAVYKSGLDKIPGFNLDTTSLLAWIDGGDDSWFSLVYPAAQLSSDFAKLLRGLHQRTVRPAQSTLSHQSSQPHKNTRSTKSTGSIVGTNYFAPLTPPAPASVASLLTGSAQQALLEAPAADVPQNSRAVVDLGVPQLAELARDQKATNKAQRDLAHSKAAYLRIQAQVTGITMLQQLHQHDLDVADRKQAHAFAVLGNPNSTQKLREKAEGMIEKLLDASIKVVNYTELIERIGDCLPTINNIADAFYNAPALREGASEQYQAEQTKKAVENSATVAQAGPSSAVGI
ncbi:hypothetical protein RhiJN_19952 [Ceratobasidium sp. AG-Ba]|nr:hypothetical protein RhiJN_19952 [Ceratobasidium sp. AG-Ba]